MKLLTDKSIENIKAEAIKAYKSSDEFKTDAGKYVFSNQKKPDVKTEVVFTDSEGRKYYQYVNLGDIPIARREQLDILFEEHKNKVQFIEISLFIDAGRKILESGESVVSRLGFWLERMAEREEMLFHPGNFMEMASCLIIREDQDPTVWDEDLEKEKIEQFKKDSKEGGGLHGFFTGAGLTKHFPFLERIEKDFDKYFEAMTKMTVATKEAMMKYVEKK